MLITRLTLILLFTLVVNSLSSKEILYEGKYFKSETSLSDFLYLSEDYKPLISITVEGIQGQRPCSYLEPFLQNSFKFSALLRFAGRVAGAEGKNAVQELNNDNDFMRRTFFNLGKALLPGFIDLVAERRGDASYESSNYFLAVSLYVYHEQQLLYLELFPHNKTYGVRIVLSYYLPLYFVAGKIL